MELEIQIKTLPSLPGVYQYYDKNGTILYVGKAKNLKKRVSSYFNKNHENGKTNVLVKKIVTIEHIVVDTETDALLLENNLIKKYQPRYNVMLKDDKTYPWICIKKERFPRIFLTRNVIKDGSEYYGPYPSVKMAKALLDLIKELYQLRSCSYDLSEKNI
ncbi:MAG TPA: excinuclease ABC subunit C, partial [Lutibacter sp.]|nr:excinuclease ABC subunit C [Lutibacter sp.]